MNPVHAKILNRCREAVAKERGFSIVDFELSCSLLGTTETRAEFENEAALLAMEELAGFYEWASVREWILSGPDETGQVYFKNPGRQSWRYKHELYEQWEREKTTTN